MRNPARVGIVFGTRPECIKLAPVIRVISESKDLEPVVIISSQHSDLLIPFLESFEISADYDLALMRESQTPSDILSRVLQSLAPILEAERPDLVLVQGDTTTALGGAISSFHAGIPVGHVEAGLRTDDPNVPFPEEMNRRLITRLSTLHFAATEMNVRNLLNEGTANDRVFLTGNPVVDALDWIINQRQPSKNVSKLLDDFKGRKLVVLTTHRRESFGNAMRQNMKAVASFAEENPNVAVVFPVHPNPSVRSITQKVFGESDSVKVIDPLPYPDFIHLLAASWLIVSDSGGIQEEAPSLGKKIIVLREVTERPEAVERGYAVLIGNNAKLLKETLDRELADSLDKSSVVCRDNVFGAGDAAEKITSAILRYMDSDVRESEQSCPHTW